ncbi:MAG: hypothetical protein GY810_04730 [Aureispira sp.]|nr:hypothetical protein [Aureispira sp.]
MKNFLLKKLVFLLLLLSMNISSLTAQSKKEIDAFKKNLTNLLDAWNSDEENSHKFAHIDGITNLYLNEKESLGFKLIGNLVGEPVFSKGPHEKKMNLNANTIGYYNPKFLKRLEKYLEEIFSDKVWVDKYREVYYNSVYQYLNELRIAYRYISENEEKVKKAIVEFEEGRSNKINIEGVASPNLDEITFLDVYSGQRLNFWARRYMDGTVDQFKKLLDLVTDAFEIQKMQVNPFVIGVLVDVTARCYDVPINLKLKKANTDDSYWIEDSDHRGILSENTELIIDNIKKYKIEVFERTIFRNRLSYGARDFIFFYDGTNVESTGNYCTEWEKLEPNSQNTFRFKDRYENFLEKTVLEACPKQATANKDQINDYFLNRIKETKTPELWGDEESTKPYIETLQTISKRAIQIQVRYIEKGKQKVITYTFFTTVGAC